jgi:hypothetical protein
LVKSKIYKTSLADERSLRFYYSNKRRRNKIMPITKMISLIIKTMEKVNLNEFQASKLSLSERLNTKGGSGAQTSSRHHTTMCTGPDADSTRSDSD